MYICMRIWAEYYIVSQAKVIAINGISTRHEYLSVYKYLHTWYSPSNCYMYAQPLDHEAMVCYTAATLIIFVFMMYSIRFSFLFQGREIYKYLD